MKKNILLSVFFLLSFSVEYTFATHIVGGEMSYRNLGNNNYEITLTVYRDCYNGVPPFDNPASIGIFSANNSFFSMEQVSYVLRQPVPNAINSPCLTPPGDVCYEVAQYVFQINLPPGNGSYTVAYQRCCRNGSIVNLANVQGTGATYFTVIPDPNIIGLNNSPVFIKWPPTFICKDAPFTFDHSATDADGDSLVYEISNPYDGADQSNPMPSPPSNPPYPHVVFQPPYSINNPFGGVPINIDPVTGKLTATPNVNGQFVYGITVKEYRNGVLLGETKRDFQVNVIDCPQITVASIFSPTIACGSLDAHFINTSYNAATYSWFFGDSTALNDSSNLVNPIYTYPDTGHYIATLVAYSGINPLCNDTAVGPVYVYPIFLTKFLTSNKHCDSVFTFVDMSYGLSGSSDYWFWNFGDDSISFDPNPVHTYARPGTYNVSLVTSTDSACLDTATKKVYVLQNPVSGFSLILDTCTYEIHLKDSSSYATGYRWEFGDWGTGYFKTGSHKYSSSGSYDIRLIVSTDSSCIDTSVRNIKIPPLPIPDFTYDVLPCDSTVQFNNFSLNAKTYLWDFGDNVTSDIESPKHTYSISGSIPVKLSAFSQQGCQADLDKSIFFISKKLPDFETLIDSCSGIISFNDLTNRAAYYYWDFGDGVKSYDMNPTHVYKDDGEHNVTLVVNRETQCADSIIHKVFYEGPLGEKLFIPNSFTPNADGHNDFYSMSIFRPCEIYKMTVYNRWGQKVFESDDAANVKWDGSFNGDLLPEDVYVYILENNGARREGTITIIR